MIFCCIYDGIYSNIYILYRAGNKNPYLPKNCESLFKLICSDLQFVRTVTPYCIKLLKERGEYQKKGVFANS